MEKRAKEFADDGTEARPEFIYVDPEKLPWSRWFLRKVYTLLHALFASFWFYFIPFASIILSYRIPYSVNANYYTSDYAGDAD